VVWNVVTRAMKFYCSRTSINAFALYIRTDHLRPEINTAVSTLIIIPITFTILGLLPYITFLPFIL